jgi:hypothetical protein
MKTIRQLTEKFEAKVELIPTAKLVGISGSYSPLLAANKKNKIQVKYLAALRRGSLFWKHPIYSTKYGTSGF